VDITCQRPPRRSTPAFCENPGKEDASQVDVGAPDSTRGFITAPYLGAYGRWGNTLLQYMFLRAFADCYGLELKTPLWLGKYLFGLNESLVSGSCKTIVIDEISAFNTQGSFRFAAYRWSHERAQEMYESGRDPILACAGDAVHRDVTPPFNAAEMEGLFLVHTKYLAPYKERFLSLLQPVTCLKDSLAVGASRLRSLGRTIVGVHIRRGDFLVSFMCQRFELVVPLERYREWLRSLWPTLDEPVLLLATDDEEILPYFAEFAPVTARSLCASIPESFEKLQLSEGQGQRSVDFFADWYLLTACDILVISNSTFSFSAALLNPIARQRYRPTFDCEFVAFDPWDSEPLLFSEPHRFVIWEFARNVARTFRISGARSALKALYIAVETYRVLVLRRALYALRRRGWMGLLKTLFDPRLYFSSKFGIT
jgi:hypothetical protein